MTRIFPFVLTLLLLSGCAQFQQFSIPEQPSREYLSELIETEKFNQAIDALDKWQNNAPDNTELNQERIRLSKAISRYESNIVSTAKDLEKKRQWLDAEKTLKSGLDTLGDSKVIKNANTRFTENRSTYSKDLIEKLDIETAKSLAKISPLLTSLNQVSPTNDINKQWQDFQSQHRQTLIERLIAQGDRHKEKNRADLAAQVYRLAYRLAPSEENLVYKEFADKHTARVKAKEIRKSKKLRAKITKQTTNHVEKLQDDFDLALLQNDLSLAKQHLSTLEKIDANTEQLTLRKAELSEKIEAAVTSSRDLGQSYYRNGNFLKAIETWNKALELRPNDEMIRANIEKARIFQEKLDKLKKK